MGFLIDIINERERAKYEQNALKLQRNVIEPITKREYLVPNNAKSSATYFWQNVLLIPPAADRHTFPLTFIPSDNKNIAVRARFSNHPSGPLENWTKYEAMGSPNKRVDIYFFGADDSDDPNGDVESHVISNKHLYSDSDVKLLQQALANFFKSGNFVNPFCENNENNNTELINCNTNMNKKLIRLTEGDLHKIVKESVNRILREAAYNMNSPEYKQMYDKGLETHWDGEDKAQTNKEIADYEALPDKARHPYGTEIPNFDDRVKKRNGFGFWRPNDGDKLASKKPNSIYKKQQEKRDYEEYVTEYYKKAMRDLPFLFEYLREKFGVDDPRKLSKDEIVVAYENYKDRQRERQRESEWYL